MAGPRDCEQIRIGERLGVAIAIVGASKRCTRQGFDRKRADRRVERASALVLGATFLRQVFARLSNPRKSACSRKTGANLDSSLPTVR
jgi:hypothetical protein